MQIREKWKTSLGLRQEKEGWGWRNMGREGIGGGKGVKERRQGRLEEGRKSVLLRERE